MRLHVAGGTPKGISPQIFMGHVVVKTLPSPVVGSGRPRAMGVSRVTLGFATRSDGNFASASAVGKKRCIA